MRAQAESLAKQGFRVFPLEPNKKTPAVKRWQNEATTDPAKIAEWWPAGSKRGIGIATGRGLLVIDIDVDKGGYGSLAVYEDMNETIPKNMRVRTASGGMHIYLRCEGETRNTASKVAPGIDTRGDGGYVVAPGTTIDGKTYEVLL